MKMLHVAIGLTIAAGQALEPGSAPSSVQRNAERQEIRNDQPC